MLLHYTRPTEEREATAEERRALMAAYHAYEVIGREQLRDPEQLLCQVERCAQVLLRRVLKVR